MIKAIAGAFALLAISATHAEEKNYPERSLNSLVERVSLNPITDVETYRSRDYIAAKATPMFIQYSTKNKSKPAMTLVFNYQGKDWVFVDKVSIRCDDQVFELKIPKSLTDQRAYGGFVIETAVLPYTGTAVKAAECIAKKPAKKIIQFEGKYRHSEDLPDYVSRGLNDMIYVQKNWTELISRSE